MNPAVAERAHLAAIGSDLLPLVGDAGSRRAQGLFGTRGADPAIGFADLARAPGWLRQGKPALAQLAREIALVAMGPAIAVAIDGDWLGELAHLAGEPALDRAIAIAPRVPGGGLARTPGAAVEGLGFDLMRAALTAPLQSYLGWAATADVRVTAALAHFCLIEVSRG